MENTDPRYDIYCEIWDLYKDVYGIRPRGFDFSAMSMEEMENWNGELISQLKVVMEEEEEMDRVAVGDFKSLIERTIELGAGDRKTALRWLMSDYNNLQDIEHWLWDHGILFTDYGRKIKSEIVEVIAQ